MTQDIETISNEDLLAILLSSGTRGESAKTLATEVLKLYHAMDSVEDVTITKLLTIHGIGKVKAMTILAALEFGKRMQNKRPEIMNQIFRSSDIVYEYYHDKLSKKKQEYFYCLYLDTHKRIIKEKLLFIGTVNHSTIHPREIFKEAYLVSASTIICVHNHPGDSVTPSKLDIEVTNQLVTIGNLLGIPVIDHIIIGSCNYYSFFEHRDK